MSRWADVSGGASGRDYAERFARLADSGRDMHGEAAFCAGLLEPGARVLDAGCGTGRVALRLDQLGFDCTGVDLDESMLDVARGLAPDLQWLHADLAELDRSLDGLFDLVVAAGNVIPLVAAGSEPAVIGQLAARLAPHGVLVTGFGLDAAHLPLAQAPFGLGEYDGWCTAAGLVLVQRFATWAADPFAGGGYAVSVHARASAV